MNQKRDYTSRSFVITFVVVVLLLGISRIPRFKVGEVSLKKINILSDLIKEDFYPSPETDSYFDTTFLAEGEALEAAAKADSAPMIISVPVVTPASLVIPAPMPVQAVVDSPNQAPVPTASITTVETSTNSSSEIPFLEDFGINGVAALSHFYGVLTETHKKQPIRIAVLGDSFIEGDIITADIREQLQDLYGGKGVGFVPFASPIAKFRGTTSHTFTGWEVLNVKNARRAPAELQDKFFVSGNLCIPAEGAYTQLKGVSFRKHIQRASVAKLIFMNRQHTTIQVTINDSIQHLFAPESGTHVQQIEIEENIQSIRVSLSAPEGFIGYGIVLEDQQGVSVDNFSIRGNSSLALFGTNGDINTQIGQMRRYDLVILQYGLNVMSQDVLHYDSYSKAFVKVINYMKRCFPGSSILVMGVCDRSMQRDGEFVTMPAVPGMIQAQRNAAQETGVAFWNTFEAMGGQNSMTAFVKKQWAAKDYTHIGYAGGKFIAGKLVKSWLQGAEIAKQHQMAVAKQRELEQLHYNLPDTNSPSPQQP